jgi:RHS repeat-associated protein
VIAIFLILKFISEKIKIKTLMNNKMTTYYVANASGAVVQGLSYDAWGRLRNPATQPDYGCRISITDPSAGNRSFGYDAAGHPNSETDANSRTKSMTYDKYGRILTKNLNSEITTSYTYDTGDFRQLLNETSSNGTSAVYTYDIYGRDSTVRENAPDSKYLTRTYAYSNGNVSSIQYVSQSGTLGTESYEYANGHLKKIIFAGNTVWELTGENALGQPTGVTTGNIVRTYGYTSYGMTTARSATAGGSTVQNFTYQFDPVRGNLTWRRDVGRNIQENFTYDYINRLQNYGSYTAGYDAKGNITGKTDIGASFQYTNTAKPYAVSSVDLGATPTDYDAIPLRNQSVAYTSFERPASISENGMDAAFTYNANGDRVKMSVMNGSANVLTRYYLGGQYEIDGGTTATYNEKLYLGGDYYSAPAVYVKSGGSWYMMYILRDYLGNITHLANANGAVVQELSYDAWGRLRNPATQQTYTPGNEPNLYLGRGYTGHEHLPWFGLVNMNARLYDPALGRFLSPDPYVQNPFGSQNFNRYSYAMNNPLIYGDPNGEIAWFIPVIIGAIVGAYSGGVIANEGQYNPIKWDYNSGKTWGYMLGGAVVGGVSGGFGSSIAASGGFMANTMGIIGGSFMNSVGMGLVTDGQVPVSVSFGVASYDFTNNEFGYLGEKGNKWYENVGYGFGALANASDLVSLFRGRGQNVSVNSAKTEGDDWWGHSSITDENGKTLVSVGPDSQVQKSASLSETWQNSIKGAVEWDTYLGERGTWTVELKNVSTTAISKYASGINRWDLLLNSCVGHTSKALWTAGVPNIYLFHPHVLNFQLLIRQLGIYSSPYIYQIP